MKTVFKCDGFVKLFTIATEKLKKQTLLLLLLLIIYHQCYMMINKFGHDFIKLFKYENLFMKRMIVFQMRRHFDFKHS